MTDYKRSIVVEIDGTGAVVGARKVQASLNDIDRATKNVDGGMRRVGDASRSATSSMHGLGTAAKAAMAYFSVSTMVQFGKAVFDAGVAMDSLQRSFVAISGSQVGAALELDFLRDTADRLGQSFYDLAPAYKSISAAARGTEMEGESVRLAFVGIVEATTALGMSGVEASRGLQQLTQMISKNKVEYEDLKTMAESFPGAIDLFSRAIGKSIPVMLEMMSKGEILTKDVLPGLYRELHNAYGAVAQTSALESAQAAINKMSDAWTDFKTNLYDSDQAVQGINAITSAIKTLTEYAGLRSISETFAEGAKMAQEGKLNWEEFKKASYMDRQRMVDSGGMMSTFRGKVNRDDVRNVPPSVAASAVATTKSKTSGAKSAETSIARMQEEIARLTLSAADFEHYQVDQEFAKIAKEIGAANPLLAQWVALRREEAELTRGKEVDKELADFFGDIDKQSAELIEKAKTTNERNEEILLDFSDRYREIVVGETEFKKEQLDRQAEIFRKAGADEVAVAQWVAQEKLAVSRDWQDGATRAMQSYADEAGNAAQNVEDVMTMAFHGIEDAVVEFVKTGKLEFSDLVTSINAEIARLAFRSLASESYNFLGSVLNMGLSAAGSYFSGGSSVAAGSAGGGFNYAGEMSSFFSTHHSGGIVGSEATSMRLASPMLFAGASRFHSGGIAGDEVPAILKRGEGVFTEGQMKALGGSDSETKALLRELVAATRANRGTKVVNAIGKGAIANELSGSEGEQVIFNHIRRNPSAVRRMLGL